jgi:hypothetical protein
VGPRLKEDVEEDSDRGMEDMLAEYDDEEEDDEEEEDDVEE